jgi:hypothetical protein
MPMALGGGKCMKFIGGFREHAHSFDLVASLGNDAIGLGASQSDVECQVPSPPIYSMLYSARRH